MSDYDGIIPRERLNSLRYSWDNSLNMTATPDYDIAPALPVLPVPPPVDDSLFYYREDGMPDPRVKIQECQPSMLEKILGILKF